MSGVKGRTPESKPQEVARRDEVQRASIAELLLVARLRARNRRDLAVDTLERAAQVLWVTCKNWFTRSSRKPSDQDDSSGPNREA
ncbi:hypothetical protein [Polaromonas sp. UC242_47]|uniref:hypothetical protein n=1 Tax=Polaromonas sp. UC242_47 TaxID=3374626 RepID=UPI0037A6A7A0